MSYSGNIANVKVTEKCDKILGMERSSPLEMVKIAQTMQAKLRKPNIHCSGLLRNGETMLTMGPSSFVKTVFFL